MARKTKVKKAAPKPAAKPAPLKKSPKKTKAKKVTSVNVGELQAAVAELDAVLATGGLVDTEVHQAVDAIRALAGMTLVQV